MKKLRLSIEKIDFFIGLFPIFILISFNVWETPEIEPYSTLKSVTVVLATVTIGFLLAFFFSFSIFSPILIIISLIFLIGYIIKFLYLLIFGITMKNVLKSILLYILIFIIYGVSYYLLYHYCETVNFTVCGVYLLHLDVFKYVLIGAGVSILIFFILLLADNSYCSSCGKRVGFITGKGDCCPHCGVQFTNVKITHEV